MHILICRSNPVAPDPRVEKEAVSLTEAGYKVSVIGWDRSASLPLSERRGKYKIHRIPIHAQYGMGTGNLIKLITWQIRLFLWLVFHHKDYDVLHACDFDTVLPCMVMKLAFHKKLVYDIFDFYSDHLRNTPEWVKKNIRALDYWVINHADGVILVDDTRREQVKETKPRQLSIIYNSPQDISVHNQYQPSPKGRLRLTYVGLFQKERGLIEMASVMKKHPKWNMDMAGFGGDEKIIHPIYKDLPNVNWHGRIPYQKAIELSAQADVLFATYDPAIPNHRYSSPNKIFEAMMLAKPIIVAHGTNMDLVVSKNECGIVVPYGNTSQLEEALLQLAEDPALREQLGKNARRAYETLYKWDIMKLRLHELYSQILKHV